MGFLKYSKREHEIAVCDRFDQQNRLNAQQHGHFLRTFCVPGIFRDCGQVFPFRTLGASISAVHPLVGRFGDRASQ